MIALTLNGEARQFPAPLTVAGLVEHLGLTGKRIAVEKNGEIIPKSQHASTGLARSLQEAGVKPEQLEDIAKLAINDGSAMMNPEELRVEDALALAKRAYEHG